MFSEEKSQKRLSPIIYNSKYQLAFDEKHIEKYLSEISSNGMTDPLGLINKLVFDGGDKSIEIYHESELNIHVIIRYGKNENDFHSFSRLSKGEKSIIKIILMIYALKTQNTIVIIDDLFEGLHVRLQHKMFNIIKTIIATNCGLSIIFTTHQAEIIDQYLNTLNLTEREFGDNQDVNKCGHLIERQADSQNY